MKIVDRRIVLNIGLFCIVATFIGCGPDHKARGTVKGKVTVGGKNLTAGTVLFSSADGTRTGSATIDHDGNYVCNSAPVGEMIVTVTVPKIGGQGMMMKGAGMPAGGKSGMPKGMEMKNPETGESMKGNANMGMMDPSKIVPIDEKYAKTDTSGLKFTVEANKEQTFDINLTK